MDATCTIQDSIHVFNLVHKYVSRILGTYHECVGKDWVNIWNDKKTPNAGENVIVMRCHSHYAALHAHVALARYTSSPKISRL